jgi:hypothetical protein
MNNSLISIDENITDVELDVYIEKAIFTKIKRVENKLAQIEDRQKYLEEKTSTRLDETDLELNRIKEDTEKKLEVAVNSLRQEIFDGYLNQGDFGRQFIVSISSIRIGKLFRIVGLAQISKGQTTAYRQYVPKYAKVITERNGDISYSKTTWHYTNCMEFIDLWLKENNLFEKFYSISTEKEMEKFIDKQFDFNCKNANYFN